MTTGLLLAFCFGAAPIQAWGGLFNRFNPSLMSDIYGDGSYGKELYRASEGNGRPAATKVRMSVVKRGFCLCPKIVLIKHIGIDVRKTILNDSSEIYFCRYDFGGKNTAAIYNINVWCSDTYDLFF